MKREQRYARTFTIEELYVLKLAVGRVLEGLWFNEPADQFEEDITAFKITLQRAEKSALEEALKIITGGQE